MGLLTWDRASVTGRLLAMALIGLAACSGPQFLAAGSRNAAWVPVVRDFEGVPMAYVPAGCFQMGSREGEREESPVRRVCLNGFWIGQTEVTNAQYAACVEAGACTPPADRTYFDSPAHAEHPVVFVSWDQAEDYARWRGGRLPTEAQWEYAARGPEGHRYPWGSGDPTCEKANLNACAQGTLPVGSGQRAEGASWVGALDMAGNVWEWVDGWYDDGYYVLLEDGALDPPGPGEGRLRVLRGGAWNTEPYQARAAFRSRHSPRFYAADRGFRIVLFEPPAP